jgi:transcriptional regulator with XRE-family HTH domain
VNDKEALERIGHLIRDARKHHGESMAALAKRAGINSKTLWSAEKGERFPHDANQLKIERALGWRDGSITEAYQRREDMAPENLTLEWMRAGGDSASWGELAAQLQPPQVAPLARAINLSDEELLLEISYRFRNYREENSRLREQLGA